MSTAQDELQSGITAAREAEQVAMNAMSRAMSEFRRAAARRMELELQQVDPARRMEVLCDFIRSNRAEWSGGVYCRANVTEALIREEAIRMLRNVR